ncbi:copper chaperone PCu(A)C [uncultured Vibrio sp.]|uniref:copper chaperone PCu(A)C n=1 Tax=uncultured Vibrio sp. TaxID=114054 RepID=UPI002AAB42F3|nr:copper chaperone PCu(A)C [uncultured Vibrio sp.]
MKKYLTYITLCIAALVTSLASAHEYTTNSIQIDHPWSREAPPNATVIAGFFQLKNLSTKDDFLISATTPIAERVEIHQHEMSDGVMKMKKIDNVRISSMKSVMFEPGGYHLMIFNPEPSFRQGERFPMTLEFRNAGKVAIELAVEANTYLHSH